MARCRIPQIKVAEALGISQVAVSRRLNGHVPFTVTELDVVAGLLGVTAALLVSPPVRVVA